MHHSKAFLKFKTLILNYLYKLTDYNIQFYQDYFGNVKAIQAGAPKCTILKFKIYKIIFKIAILNFILIYFYQTNLSHVSNVVLHNFYYLEGMSINYNLVAAIFIQLSQSLFDIMYFANNGFCFEVTQNLIIKNSNDFFIWSNFKTKNKLISKTLKSRYFNISISQYLRKFAIFGRFISQIGYVPVCKL